jgi:hypothetical protein
MLVAKLALGFASTLAVAGAYTFRQGVIRVDVDEYRQGGSHVHLWVPAAAIPVALHMVPRSQVRLEDHKEQLREALPIVRVAVEELKRFPNTTFVEVQDGDQHVIVSTQGGKLRVDVTGQEESAHVLVPLSTIEDVFEQMKVWTDGSDTPM